ncbi:HalOD1 output domain-containing protein [Halomontanus rarus]|uniref:HalOD1 output domain-containing protein n=1 Tax=Halomontanus rarus TaxID=3034020 RepID=UPI0023E7FC1F|nr:HalOD1 output domain-containing protein [Halovivax sp. TS33]
MTREPILEVDGDQYRSITEAVVRAAAAVRNDEITEMQPLYHAIDSDALERLFTAARDVSVAFEYAGLSIRVDSSRTVFVDGEVESSLVDSDPDPGQEPGSEPI